MTPYNPRKHHRRSIRLKGYDYTYPGAYFITTCTHQRVHLFGEVVDGTMRLNEAGRLVEWTWNDLPNHVPNIILDAFVIMPNHVHGIIVITDTVGSVVGAGSEPALTEPALTEPALTEPAPTTAPATKRYALPEIVRQLKTFSARRINQLRGTPDTPVWQRNYYEHIIRSDRALNAIRRYIVENPLRWHIDRYHPHHHPGGA